MEVILLTMNMNNKPNLSDINQNIPLADIKSNELNEIKAAENKLGNKYYLLAFERSEKDNIEG